MNERDRTEREHSEPSRSADSMAAPAVSARDIWRALAAPGSWWSSDERIGLMRESRMAHECLRCARAKKSTVPVIGRGHTHATALPLELIDVCHTLVELPETISREWYEARTRETITPSSYVEAAATVTVAAALDAFVRQSEGAELPLPDPIPGARSERPTGLGLEVGAWMPGAAGGRALTIRGARGRLPGSLLTRLSRVLNVSPPSLEAVAECVELLEVSGARDSTHALLTKLAVAVGLAAPSALRDPTPGAVRRLLRQLVG